MSDQKFQTLISAATAAAAQAFYLSGEDCPAQLVADDMSSGDTVDVQISGDFGATYENAYDKDGQVQLAYQSVNVLSIHAPGHYKVNKGTTTGTVQVTLIRGRAS